MRQRAASPPSVFVVAPGGRSDRAGIGRLITTVTDYWREHRLAPPLRIVDPYGPGIRILTPCYLVRALLQILWNAWRGRILLLHIHMAIGGSVLRKGLVALVGERIGLPVIVHLHGTRFEEQHQIVPRVARHLLLRAVRRAAAVIVLGTDSEKAVVSEIGQASRVHIVPNAVRGPAATLPQRDAAQPCRILFLGRLEAEKGFAELLDALATPALGRLQWQARCAGPGNLALWRQRAAVLGLAGRVEIFGWTPEAQVRQWLAASDIFVLPSHHEGLSMALLEAMAFGLAVITTPVGAAADAVEHGMSGLLVPVHDVPALTAALTSVITDSSLRAALQAGARRRFHEQFDIALHCQRLVALYGEVGQGSVAPSPDAARAASRS